MFDINTTVINGNVTRDAEYLPNTNKVIKFSIVHNKRKKNPTTQKWEDTPYFFDCKIIGEVMSRVFFGILKKGLPVVVSGELEYQSWTLKDGSGKMANKIYILVHSVKVMNPKKSTQTVYTQEEPKIRSAQEMRQSGEYDDLSDPFV